jgi:hypothetical protein
LLKQNCKKAYLIGKEEEFFFPGIVMMKVCLGEFEKVSRLLMRLLNK